MRYSDTQRHYPGKIELKIIQQHHFYWFPRRHWIRVYKYQSYGKLGACVFSNQKHQCCWSVVNDRNCNPIDCLRIECVNVKSIYLFQLTPALPDILQKSPNRTERSSPILLNKKKRENPRRDAKKKSKVTATS